MTKKPLIKDKGKLTISLETFQEDLHPHFIVTSAYSSQIKEGTFSMKSSSWKKSMDFDFLFFYLKKCTDTVFQNFKKRACLEFWQSTTLRYNDSGYFWLKFSYAEFEINMWENSNLYWVSSMKLSVSWRHSMSSKPTGKYKSKTYQKICKTS